MDYLGAAPRAALLSRLASGRVGTACQPSLRLLGSGFIAFTRWCLTPFGQALSHLPLSRAPPAGRGKALP